MLSLFKMKSKVLFIGILAGIVLIAGLGYFFLVRKSDNTTTSPVSQELPETTVPEKFLTWNDQAGFTFQYPEGLQSDKHEEDKENYSHIDFTKSGETGGILVMASDTKYKNVDEWVKADKTLAGGLVVDTTLGGKPAKKISFADSGKIIVGAIDMQILFTFQMTDTGTYWKPIFDKIISTYEFVYPTAVPQKSSGSSEGDIIEEEEIIE